MPGLRFKAKSVRWRRGGGITRPWSGRIHGRKRVRKARAELLIVAGRPEIMRRRHQDAADRGGIELRIAFDEQRRNAADLGRRKRGSRRHLIAPVGGSGE